MFSLCGKIVVWLCTVMLSAPFCAHLWKKLPLSHSMWIKFQVSGLFLHMWITRGHNHTGFNRRPRKTVTDFIYRFPLPVISDSRACLFPAAFSGNFLKIVLNSRRQCIFRPLCNTNHPERCSFEREGEKERGPLFFQRCFFWVGSVLFYVFSCNRQDFLPARQERLIASDG